MKFIKNFPFILVLVLVSCKTEPKNAIQTESITFSKEGELSVIDPKTEQIKASFEVELAETPYETQTGLMYRASMEESQGMLFIFPDVTVHSFYMKNTEFSLDIIFIDENLNIVSFQKNAKPFDENGLSSIFPIKYVLEINAGLSDRLGLAVGDRISYTRI